VNKYRNVKTEVDGIVFASKKEADRYQELKLLERAGKICDIKLQPKFLVIPVFTSSSGVKHRATHYVADFMYEVVDGKAKNLPIVEDAKGVRTKEYIIKRKLFEHQYPDILFREV